MREQQDALADLLTSIGFRVAEKPPRPRIDKLPSAVQPEIVDLYRQLGGLDPLPVQAGPWDMAFDGLIVEYDEEQHFNRYRAAALTPDWSYRLPWRVAYLGYSAIYEDECRRKASGGKFWTSVPSQRMFGPAGPRGVLDGLGSPRWKQRAFYDAIRDATALNGGDRMARLSMYDEINGVQLGRALRGKAALDSDALRALTEERTVGGHVTVSAVVPRRSTPLPDEEVRL